MKKYFIAFPNFRKRHRPKEAPSFDEMEERALLFKDYQRFRLIYFSVDVYPDLFHKRYKQKFDTLNPTGNEQKQTF